MKGVELIEKANHFKLEGIVGKKKDSCGKWVVEAFNNNNPEQITFDEQYIKTINGSIWLTGRSSCKSVCSLNAKRDSLNPNPV